jgi:glycosyltransferase involved in cell wall biosynthesis
MIDGKTGFLVPLDDVETAKNRILQLIKDSALREEFSRAGKKFIEENFDKTKISQKLVRLYEN